MRDMPVKSMFQSVFNQNLVFLLPKSVLVIIRRGIIDIKYEPNGDIITRSGFLIIISLNAKKGSNTDLTKFLPLTKVSVT